ncbi:hypothetical protein KY290_029079 [Solanum tuberosum]|uniref:Reverse transcriptase zinc-binding domain-containing protein n=1 Tax=Solanum tuberosum TaxID=4113 RepID=A0ABQ7UJS8_SOLTU|nr:hypothetical protein KY290_029079 [Solanum tuberosum]
MVADCFTVTGWLIHFGRDLEELSNFARNRNGYFTVKSYYTPVQQQEENWEFNWPWKMLWRTRAPSKAVCFRWIAAKEACLTPSCSSRKRSISVQ